jgi:hypothetical protein
MKRKNLIAAGIVLVLALCLGQSQAQTTNVPAPGPVPVNPVPPPGPRPPQFRPRQPHPFIMRAMNDLRMVKADLQRSQDDFGGHKNSAIEACEKAMQELDAVLKATPPPSPQQNPPPPNGATSPLANPRAPQSAVPPPSGAPPAQPQP